jgi:hypothetical protein
VFSMNLRWADPSPRLPLQVQFVTSLEGPAPLLEHIDPHVSIVFSACNHDPSLPSAHRACASRMLLRAARVLRAARACFYVLPITRLPIPVMAPKRSASTSPEPSASSSDVGSVSSSDGERHNVGHPLAVWHVLLAVHPLSPPAPAPCLLSPIGSESGRLPCAALPSVCPAGVAGGVWWPGTAVPH